MSMVKLTDEITNPISYAIIKTAYFTKRVNLR
jgi:hypothetical protein